MRREDSFNDKFADLFSEAYDLEKTPLCDSLETVKERYSGMVFYREGGLKKIYRCRDERSGRDVAMAVLKNVDNSQKKEAFLREARLNAALQHPNIVPVYDVGMSDGEPWFTMKFIEGKSLEDILEDLAMSKSTKLNDLNDRLDVLLKVSDAVAYAHSCGIIHLDLKPDNIRISDYGDVVVCDWGLGDIIASECDEPLLEFCSFNGYDLEMMTVDGAVKGTIGYMAPEQTTMTGIRKNKYTDIFSLGAILYSLLCYKKAFSGDFKEALEKTAKCDFVEPSKVNGNLNVPFSLEAICLKAMSLNVEDRYASVEDFKRDINAYRNGFATNAEDASIIRSLRLAIVRNRTVFLMLFIALLLMVSLGAVSVRNLNLAKINAEQKADFHVKMGRDAAPRFLKRAQAAYEMYDFKAAFNFVSSAVELDPELKEAWELKGLLHFIREEFIQSVKAYKISGQKNFGIMDLAQAQAVRKNDDQKRLSRNEYLELMKTLYSLGDQRYFSNFIHNRAYSDISLMDRIAFCRGILLIRNHDLGEEFKFEFDKKSKHLDLSGNRSLKAYYCMQNFPARSADFSNTNISNFIGFRNQKLLSLNVSGTPISELTSLENRNLRELNIAHTGIVYLGHLQRIPLHKLDIRYTGVETLAVLQKMPYLRELIIHPQQFNDEQLAFVPAQVRVIVKE